jgi:cytochrome P450
VTRTLADAPYLDIFSADFHADPGASVEPLRPLTWLVQTPIGGMVIDRGHVQLLLADRRLRSSVLELVEMQGLTGGRVHELLARSLLALEGNDHTRIRRLVSRAFTPRAIDPYRPVMRETLGALLRPVTPAGECEFMGAVADHYPIEVMCHLLGVPREDHEDFARWNKAITWILSFELPLHREEAEWGVAHMIEYVEGLVTSRRGRPLNDLVTALVEAEDGGDRLSDEELLALIGGLLFAGFDTTRNQLGLAMWLFAEHPDQWELLAARPELTAKAVEEVLRFQGAVGAAPRLVVEGFELDGYRFEAGMMVALSTGAANHDPAAFDDPGVLDISADREPQLTFGGGPHYCLGANLARAELQEALPLLVGSMPRLALAGEPVWRPPIGILGPDVLPLRWG